MRSCYTSVRCLSVALFTLVLLAASASADTIYVNGAATGGNDGTTWLDAYTDLRVALLSAASGDEVWVAAGTYTPTAGADRSLSFPLVTGVGVYGGFAGTETMRSERNPAMNVTVLSGDIGVALDTSDNSYHVVAASGTDATAVIDGFTVTGGNADGASPDNLGGGLYCDPAGPTVTNVLFTNNSAANGGGLCARNGDMSLTNCGFSNNSSTGYGGGVSIVVGTFDLTNLTIVNNTATTGGGGVSGVGVTVTVENTILADNSAPDGPDWRVLSSTATFSHSLARGSGGSLLWDPAFGTDAGGNIDVKPWLVDAASDDLRPLLSSPVLEAGNSAAPGLPALDLGWNPRVAGNTVDMGAYEYLPACPAGPVVYVDANAGGAADGTSWGSAFTEMHSAINLADMCPSVTEIWVAAGEYRIQPNGDEPLRAYRMVSGVGIYGGFAGGETARSQRDWLANPTILSAQASPWQNGSRQVVRAVDVDATAVLDGFTIERAVGWPGLNGGGVYVKNASPVVANAYLDNNYNVDYGGGVYVDGGSPVMTNATFVNNLPSVSGAAVYVDAGHLTLSGGLIYQYGVGYPDCVTIAGGTLDIINVTMARDNGITNIAGTVNLVNSIVWGQEGFVGVITYGGGTTVSHSLVRGCLAPGSWNPLVGTDGGGNLDTDPLFAGLTDFHIVTGSPAINAGDNAASPLPPFDLDASVRVVDGTVDMGAYESQGVCPTVARLYVNQNVVGGAGDGTTWTDAFAELRDAMDAACSNVTEIWVAAGTYTPTDGADRNIGFRMRSGLEIYGGFSGTETSLSQRDIMTNLTVLSGEIGTPVASDNSERVVWADGIDNTAILDGFTLSHGYAVSSASGAVQIQYSDAQFRNLVFTGNTSAAYDPQGAGMYTAWGDPTISNVSFVGNQGGALSINRGAPVVTNAVFEHNTDGPALFTYGSTATVRNGIFFENADRAIENSYGSTPTFVNLTIVGTITGGIDPGAVNDAATSAPDYWNVINWGNVGPAVYVDNYPDGTYHHCIVEGSGGSGAWNTGFGIDGGGNLDTDPFVVDPVGGDLHLRYDSPAINAGSNSAPDLPSSDPDGVYRQYGGVVDIGAYEYPAPVGAETPASHLAFDAAYPNPFNPSLTVEFSLDRARTVRVDIFDVRGARVRTLLDEERGAGPQRVQWDGTSDAGTRVASGVYLVRVSSEGWKANRKVLMLK